MLLTAIAVHAGSLVIFATATGVPALLSARVVQGLSTGAALGAIGAAVLDMDRELGTFANAVAPGMGTASGAILSALAVRFLPDPTHLIYLALIGVLAVQAAAIAAMRETVSRAPGALASLRPEITLPRALRAPVLTAVPVLFAVWALAGLYGALGPALVHTLTGSRRRAAGRPEPVRAGRLGRRRDHRAAPGRGPDGHAVRRPGFRRNHWGPPRRVHIGHSAAWQYRRLPRVSASIPESFSPSTSADSRASTRNTPSAAARHSRADRESRRLPIVGQCRDARVYYACVP